MPPRIRLRTPHLRAVPPHPLRQPPIGGDHHPRNAAAPGEPTRRSCRRPNRSPPPPVPPRCQPPHGPRPPPPAPPPAAPARQAGRHRPKGAARPVTAAPRPPGPATNRRGPNPPRWPHPRSAWARSPAQPPTRSQAASVQRRYARRVETSGVEGVSALTLDWATLRALAKMTDDVGVLSIYASLDPQRRTEPQSRPAWDLRVRQELHQVQEAARRDRPREHWVADQTRLKALQMPLDELLDPASSGQGQAMFVGVASGEVRTVSLQVPLVDRVTLAARPHLRPLVTAWSTHGPSGGSSRRRGGAGGRHPVRTSRERRGLPYLPPVEQRRLQGPPPAHPGMPQQGSAQRDLYERREDDKLLRFLRSPGPRLVDLAKEREWGLLAISGDAELAHQVTEALPVRNGFGRGDPRTRSPTSHHRSSPRSPRRRWPRPVSNAGGAGPTGTRSGVQRRQRRYGLSELGRAATEPVGPPSLDADGQWRGRAP